MSGKVSSCKQRRRDASAGRRRPRTIKHFVLGALVCCCLGTSVPAWNMQPQAASSVTELAGKAKALELRGRSELAREAWEQVLQQDPQNAEALKGMVRASQATGRAADADTYLKRLRAAHPDDPGLAQLARQASGSDREVQAGEAERLARAGKYTEAVTAYRKMYGANPPPGDVALRYYAAEGATEEGRPEAIASLRALTDQFPQDRRYRRALGSLLVLNARTEQEGQKLLAGSPGRKPATAVSLAALPLERAGPGAPPQAPENVATARSAPAASPAPGPASGPERSAEPVQTQAAAKSPPAPLMLARATPQVAPAPDAPRTSKLPAPVASGGPTAQAATPVALTTASTVSASSSRENAEEERAGYAALSGGRLREAEARFKVVLARDPENGRALGGLGLLRLRQGDRPEAARLLQQAQQSGVHDPAIVRGLQQAGVSGGAALKASEPVQSAAVRSTASEPPRRVPARPLEGLSLPRVMPATARKEVSEPRTETATQTPAAGGPQLLNAQPNPTAQPPSGASLSPSTPLPPSAAAGSVELQKASSLLAEGKSAQAYAMFRAAIGNGEFENTQAWAGLFASLHGSGHDLEALAQAGAAPEPVRLQLESNPLFLETAAMVYAGQNDRAHALSYWSRLQQYAADTHTTLPAESSVAFAQWLNGAGDETHLYPVLMALGGRSDLSDTQRRALQRIWAQWAVRQAVEQARTGELDRAKLTLSTAAAAFADNSEALRTLARGFAAINQPKTAVAMLRTQDLANATAEDMAVAVNAALAAHDMKAAEAWLRSGLPRYGRNPDLLLLASRFEQETGHKREAAAYLQVAVSSAPTRSAPNAPGTPGASGTPTKTVALAEVSGSSGAAPNLAALFTRARTTENAKANAVTPGSAKRPFLPSAERAPAAAPAGQSTAP